MRAIHEHQNLQLQTVAVASALIDRYGAVVDLIEEDGFKVDARIFMLIEGEIPATMAKSTGVGLMALCWWVLGLGSSPQAVVSAGVAW